MLRSYKKPTLIDSKDVYNWVRETKVVYATDTRGGKFLQFCGYLSGKFTVTRDNETLYEGCDMFDATKAYNEA